MSAGFNVVPDVQRAAAAKLTAASDELFSAFAELSSELTSVAAMCGDDERGLAFATEWELKADEMKVAVYDAAQAVGEMGDRLSAMATGYCRCEDVNDESCRSDLGLVP